MGEEALDALAAEGAARCLAGSFGREPPPQEGQSRWSVSCLLLPDPGLAVRLDTLTHQAADLAGDAHWRTGAAGFAHVTVRSLELYRATVPADDPTLARYAAALHRAADRCGPVTLEVTGLILTPATLMACAAQVEGSADRLADAFAEELGVDGWREGARHRDIWYANLLHFAGDIARPRQLVDWVAARRFLHLGVTTASVATLAQYRWVDRRGGRGMQPVTLAQVPLSGLPARLRG